MIEPIVRAGAGRPPPGIGARIFDAITAFAVAPYAPNPNDPRKFIVDLSQYNTVDLQALADYVIPCEAAFIRIGGSASVRDTKFKQYWDAAKQAGIPRSIYTYTWPGWTVSQHISNFMASVEQWTPGDLGEGPIWVDVETHAGKTKKQVSDHAFAYMRELGKETGKAIGWYTGAWFVNGYMQQQDWMTEYWAWLATYAMGREHLGPVIIPEPIPVHIVVVQQTGSKGDATLVGGTGTYDTDRWLRNDVLFNDLFGVKPPEPPEPPDPNLEIRLAHLELQVQDNQREIKQLSERQDQTDEWGNSYGK